MTEPDVVFHVIEDHGIDQMPEPNRIFFTVKVMHQNWVVEVPGSYYRVRVGRPCTTLISGRVHFETSSLHRNYLHVRRACLYCRKSRKRRLYRAYRKEFAE